MSLIIDVRMFRNSGIGRYIEGIVPSLPEILNSEIHLLYHVNDRINQRFSTSLFKFKSVNSTYYSFLEQIELPFRLSNTSSLLWTPHYNFPFLAKIPKVVTVHDVAHLALKDIFSNPVKRAYANFLFNEISKKAERVICVSKFTKSELIKFTNIDNGKIDVIYNGLDNSWHKVKKEKNPEQTPYLLYVGNVKPHKNLKTLIKSFLNIRDSIPHNLIIVGQKEGFLTKDEEIDSLVAKASSSINFTGYIPDKLLKQYYAHADIFIFPSLYEGFGYPPIEAMACGTPVIASNAASIPEVCGDAAIYFEPKNVDDLGYKIQNLLSDDEKKNELIRKGKSQSEKFTVEKCVSQTANVLKSLL